MNTFGNIKTRIEIASINLYGKPIFKTFMNHFNSLVLENKDMAEIYYLYDDLTCKKGLDNSIAYGYLNESLEYSQILIENSKKNIQKLDRWISLFVEGNEKNYYEDIDNVIYNNSIKNLESVLESKKNIMNTLISEEKTNIASESYNLPISSMVKIANDTLKKELTYLNENDKKELSEILKLNGKELKEQFEKTKKLVLDNLKVSINESTDNELKGTINKTIDKVISAKCNHYDYYKLKKLSLGL
jgi:hypothetical protein